MILWTIWWRNIHMKQRTHGLNHALFIQKCQGWWKFGGLASISSSNQFLITLMNTVIFLQIPPSCHILWLSLRYLTQPHHILQNVSYNRNFNQCLLNCAFQVLNDNLTIWHPSTLTINFRSKMTIWQITKYRKVLFGIY